MQRCKHLDVVTTRCAKTGEVCGYRQARTVRVWRGADGLEHRDLETRFGECPYAEPEEVWNGEGK